MEMPIFPLRSPLLPGGALALNIFEPRYRAMTQECLARGTGFGVFLIEGGYEVGRPAVPHRLGCEAGIAEWDALDGGRYRLLVRGGARLRLLERRVREDGLIIGTVERIEPPDPLPLPAVHAMLGAQLAQLIEKFGDASPLPKPARLDDACWVAYRWAELLPVTPETRLRWLAIDDPRVLIDAVAQTVAELLRPR